MTLHIVHMQLLMQIFTYQITPSTSEPKFKQSQTEYIPSNFFSKHPRKPFETVNEKLV